MKKVQNYSVAVPGFKILLQLIDKKLNKSNNTEKSINKFNPVEELVFKGREHEVFPTKMTETTESICTIAGLSFTLPRRKLDLNISSTKLTLLNSSSKAVEKVCLISCLERIVCVPTPESTQKWSFILFLKDDQIVFLILVKTKYSTSNGILKIRLKVTLNHFSSCYIFSKITWSTTSQLLFFNTTLHSSVINERKHMSMGL